MTSMPSEPRSDVRWYSEQEHVFGPPQDTRHAAWPECRAYGRPCGGDCSCEIVPVQLLRDTRMWLSIEEAVRLGIRVPENWRELE